MSWCLKHSQKKQHRDDVHRPLQVHTEKDVHIAEPLHAILSHGEAETTRFANLVGTRRKTVWSNK